MKEDFLLSTGASVSFYPAKTSAPKGFLLYFHGGGFVYGSRHDIPKTLLNLFFEQNYALLAVDYLLSPNSSLAEIIDTTWSNFLELKASFIKNHPYLLCGRSAGGDLMLTLTKKIIDENLPLPESLINFYGYTDLNFINENRETEQPPLSQVQLPPIELTKKVWDDPHFNRYLYYIYAIQQRQLPKVYDIQSKDLADFALTAEELQYFPPIFSTASTTDKEVPFRYSKALKKVPNSKFVAVYDLPHDFLKSTEDPQVQKVLSQLRSWLGNQ